MVFHERQPEKLLTVREAAVLLGLKECTIRLWLYRGVLRKVKLGAKAVRVPAADIVKLIDKSFVRSGAEIVGSAQGGLK